MTTAKISTVLVGKTVTHESQNYTPDNLSQLYSLLDKCGEYEACLYKHRKFLKCQGLAECCFPLQTKGTFNLMGQRFSIWPLSVKAHFGLQYFNMGMGESFLKCSLNGT